MTFTTADTCRERCRRLLAITNQPLSVLAIAAQLDTTTTQVGRALRQLENAGLAVRQPGGCHGYGRTPDQWTAASGPKT